MIRGTSLSLKPFPTPKYFILQQLPDCRCGLTGQASLPERGRAIRQRLKCRHHPHLHKGCENNLKIHPHHFHRSYLPRSICHRDDMRLIPSVLKGHLGSWGGSSAWAAFPHRTQAAPMEGPLGAPRAEASFASPLPLRLYRNPSIMRTSHRFARHQMWLWFQHIRQLFALC